MKISTPVQKFMRCMAALLIALAVVLPAVSAGAQNLPTDTTPMTGRRSFDLLGSSELYEAEVTISLEEIKAREDNSDEYIPHVWPVRFSEHGYISSYFGTRVDPITGEGLVFHGGVDLADKPGTKIHASASGVVVDASESEGFGMNILIDHGNGYQSRYSHCNRMLVEKGDVVSQGQVIATMGATGRVTGVHLDFRIYLDEEAIDPLILLDELD